MNLRKEIQVALNNCQPNTNRVDKMVEICEKYAIHKNTKIANKRCFLVAFTGQNSNGSIWFTCKQMPSHVEIKKAITDKFPQVVNPTIFNIQEMTEQDYANFNKD